jgi:hypothetical protein
MAGYLQTPTLGLVLVIFAAVWTRSAGVLRFSGAVCLMAALGLLVGMSTFALDVVQMRSMRTAEAQPAVLAGGALQEVKYLVAFLVLSALGVGALRTAKGIAFHASRRGDAPGIVSSQG